MHCRFKATYNGNIAEKIIEELYSRGARDLADEAIQASPLAEVVAQKVSKKPTWGAYLNGFALAPVTPTVETHTDAHKEVILYASLPTLAEKDKDPLECWATHYISFPNLASLARKYLCIQATSVASEKLFSNAGLICSARRNC